MIDLTGAFGEHVTQRLQNEEIIWLSTTGSDLVPQPRPVWFTWNGASILIYSRTDGAKVRHIRKHPTVALNFNSTPTGSDIVVIIGEAHLIDSVPDAEIAAYLDKYDAGIERINMTRESFQESYDCAIRITPTRLRGF